MKDLNEYVDGISEVSHIKPNPISVIYKTPKYLREKAYLNDYVTSISNIKYKRHHVMIRKYQIGGGDFLKSLVPYSIRKLSHRIISISKVSDYFNEMGFS